MWGWLRKTPKVEFDETAFLDLMAVERDRMLQLRGQLEAGRAVYYAAARAEQHAQILRKIRRGRRRLRWSPGCTESPLPPRGWSAPRGWADEMWRPGARR